MDRLPALSAAALALAAFAPLLVACGQGPDERGLSRTEGVTANARAPAPERWCDAFYTGPDAPLLALPKIVPARPDEQLPVVPPDRWVWINLWATWCGPCRREMPLLSRWHERLARDGVPLDLWFVSVDDREEDLSKFLKENPEMAPGNSVRLASPSELNPWLARFPGAPTATIPLQIIVAPGGRVRCVRAGALRDGDFPVVKSLFPP